MRKNKGFTLIELLGVIVILAVILVIAVPKILDVIESSRMSAFKDSAGLMAKSAQLKFAETNVLGSSKNEVTYTFENGDYTSSNTLDFKGDKPDNGIIKVNSEGRVALAIVSKDGKYCATKSYSNKNVSVKTTGDGICKVDDEIKATIKEDNLDTFTVTFNDDGEETKVKVKAQNKVEVIDSKGKEDYIFKYWSLKEDGEEYDFETLITKNITLYAVYELNTVIVTFNDEGTQTTKTLISGNTIDAIESKGKDGYNFKYWSSSENGEEYDFSIAITSDITLYAVYEIADPTVCTANQNQTVSSGIVCKRAEKLHVESCVGSCTNVITAQTDIIYGSCGSKGTLKSGDAFDCDVDGSGTYDSDERFYYITNLSTNNNYAVLIYYSNVSGGVANNTASYAYDATNISVNSNGENWHGPITARTQLPTTSQWKNVSLSSTTRAIKTETGGTSVDASGTSFTNTTLPTAFSYSGYAARLLTYQEAQSACGSSMTNGSGLDTCNYLMENTLYQDGTLSSGGWRLETPVGGNTYAAWTLEAGGRWIMNGAVVANPYNFGVRPVIEVLKTKISY